MNKKFYFGLFLLVSGSSALSAVVTLFLKDKIDARKMKDEVPTVTMTGKEVIAHSYAIKSVVEKADAGGYDDAQDPQAAMENDFKFFKIDFMES